MEKKLIGPTACARKLGVSRSWVYTAAREGRIPSVRLGGPQGPLRFDEAAIDAWIESGAGAPVAA